jgi:bacteriochlorophyll 4-vinyl reductase
MTVKSGAGQFIPASLLRSFVKAVGEQMGSYSLQLMLRQAGLERYLDTPAAKFDNVQVSEYSNLTTAIRVYFGRGARGCLMRVGENLFRDMLKNASPSQRVQLVLIKSLPQPLKVQKMMEYVAASWQIAPGDVTVHSMDQELLFVDRSGRCQYISPESEPVCWVTTGLLQESLYWATAKNIDVEEIACMAQGHNACKFKVSP